MPRCLGRPGSVRAIRIAQRARCALDVQTFWPSTIQSPASSRTRAGRQRRQVRTGSGLAEQLAPHLLAGPQRAQQTLLLLVGAVAQDGGRGHAEADADAAAGRCRGRRRPPARRPRPLAGSAARPVRRAPRGSGPRRAPRRSGRAGTPAARWWPDGCAASRSAVRPRRSAASVIGSSSAPGRTTRRPVDVPSATRWTASAASFSANRPADQRLDGALRGELGEFLVAGVDRGRVLGVVEAPVQAQDRVVLHQRVVEGRGGDGAAGEADDDDPALEGDALDGLGVRVAAHRVVDHIRAAAAGGLLHGGDDVVTAPVEDHVAAQCAGDAGLVLAADDADDLRARGLAELYGGAADAPCRGVHEQGLARLETGPAVQSEPAGLVADVQRRGLGVVQGLGGRAHRRRVDDRELGEPAVGQRRLGQHPRPDLAGRALPHGEHLAADLHAGGERQRRPHLVLAAAQQGVGEVDVGGPHPQQQLPGPGCGSGTSSSRITSRGSPFACTRHAFTWCLHRPWIRGWGGGHSGALASDILSGRYPAGNSLRHITARHLGAALDARTRARLPRPGPGSWQ